MAHLRTPTARDRHLAEVSPFGRVLFTSRSAVVNRALRGEAVLMLASPSRSPRYSRLSSGVDGRAAPWTGDFMAIERYVENLVSISAKEPPPEKILPTRILDAPRLEDDFYLNLVDWSKTNNQIAVGLGPELYIWDATTGDTSAVRQSPGQTDRIASVAWRPDTNILAVGTSEGYIEMFDVVRNKRLVSCRSHASRISVLSWHPSGTLSSGGRDRAIQHYDPRTPRFGMARWCNAHGEEVCGLKWDLSGSKLASGGNDNQLLVWSGLAGTSQPASLFAEPLPLYRCSEHNAAVKAMAWSPHQAGLLASGGGTADRSIRMWNINGAAPEKSILKVATASQVCNMIWSPHSPELVTGHGFSEHQCIRWRYPKMEQTGIMTGHDQRVLYMSLSPDGTTIVTGSPDETLRFWPVFGKRPARTRTRAGPRRDTLLLDADAAR